jgi:hypothetical protein
MHGKQYSFSFWAGGIFFGPGAGRHMRASPAYPHGRQPTVARVSVY